jgi:hypothetical protein
MDTPRDILDMLAALREAIESLDWPEVDRLAGALASRAGEISPQCGKGALDRLRRARRFRPLQKLSDSLILAGGADTAVRLRHVQALLAQDELTGSVALLEDLLDDNTSGPGDRAEMLGLIGQSYKQAALAAPAGSHAARLLETAIENYHLASEAASAASDQHAWLRHRANVIALLARATRKQYVLRRVSGHPYPKLAQMLRDRVAALDVGDAAVLSDFAAALEASVALGDVDAAAKWALRLARVGANDAFEIGAILRQLVDVWDLDEHSTLGRLVLPCIKAVLLQSEGGQVALSGQTIASTVQTLSDSDYQRVFGTERYVPYEWYLTGARRCQVIARIESKFRQACGSGVLVRGSRIHHSLGESWLLLTCNHVLSRNGEDPDSLRPEDAMVTFQGHMDPDRGPFGVVNVLCSSPRNQLDATLAVVSSVPRQVPEYEVSEQPPDRDRRNRIYAIGHPLGGELSLSIADNQFLDFLEPRIHYRTPTDRGSSGSPLFDDQWNLIGLHHAGSDRLRRLTGDGFYQANEGIWIHSIISAFRRQLGLESEA